MKIAVAQVNVELAAFEKNAEKILSFIEESKARGAEIVLFPELVLFGYLPNDLLENRWLVERQTKALEGIHKKMSVGITAIVGCVSFNPSKTGNFFFNSAAVLQKNKKIQFFHKTLLPTYDVFYEHRYFESGDVSKNFLNVGGKKILITICEDIWAWKNPWPGHRAPPNPFLKIKPSQVDLILNLSGSPFSKTKFESRVETASQTAKYLKAPLIYANLIGGQDEIIYDGGNFLVNASGAFQCAAPFWEEGLFVLSDEIAQGQKISQKRNRKSKSTGELSAVGFFSRAETEFSEIKRTDLSRKKRQGLLPDEQKNSSGQIIRKQKALLPWQDRVFQGISLGISDFLMKNKLSRVHFGSSGGLDSAVIAVLAVQALGKENVVSFSLPGPFTSELSIRLAERLALNLGIEHKTSPISGAYQSLSSQFQQTLNWREFGLPFENLQSRLRGLTLMAYSNSANSLLLNTGNKSEIATGYSTLYGDMNGGLAPIGDLFKTEVFELARWINRNEEIIPHEIIERPPSAELRANQKDEDSLPPYSKLDPILEKLIVQCAEPKTELEKQIAKLIKNAEFKRWQSPPILRVSNHAFGRGRLYPISYSI